ncbi:SIMPL domain-containing protein [Cytobacillus sp. FJAT-53684]|uniref:SIMPL domain-containing protein n=1 Tax=Cytobacillus mangrovibacter TaxID=3299024 RepID=A0ABW6JUF7_9BACI
MYNQYPAQRNIPVTNKRLNVISVYGEGKVSVLPDTAEVTLGVSTEEMEVTDAQNNNAMVITKVKEGLSKIGVQEEQIQTVDYSIFPQYDFVDGKQVFRGYKVQHLLRVSIKNIENSGLVIDTAVNNGANIISGIQFTSSDTERFQHQALSLAVINAYQKADTIARTLGVHLAKEPLLVAETSQQPNNPVPFQASALVKSSTSTPIEPGTLEITKFVTAEFTFS